MYMLSLGMGKIVLACGSHKPGTFTVDNNFGNLARDPELT